MSDWFAGSSGSPVDVAALLDSGELVGALSEIVALGALVSMGTTADGGALGVTVTVDGRWRREYFRTTDEMRAWLEPAVQAVTVAVAARAASPVRRQRQRGL